MIRSSTLLTGVAAGVLLAAPGTAWAQWNASAVGVAEVDTESTLLLLAGVSASPGGMGIAPLVGVQASHLSYDVVDTRNSATSGSGLYTTASSVPVSITLLPSRL